MNDFNVFIPSLNRPEIFKNNTGTFVHRWLPNVFVIVPNEQVELYEKHNPDYVGRIFGHPDSVKSIGDARQYCLDKFPSKYAFQFDDDVKLYIRTAKNKSRITTDAEVDDALDLLLSWLSEKGVAQAGFGASFMLYQKPEVAENQLCGMAFGLDVKAMEQHNIRYDDFHIYEDSYVSLRLLLEGYKNRVSYKYIIKNIPADSSGGCSTYRNMKWQHEYTDKFSNMYPKFVTKYIRKKPWLNLGDGVPNVRIQWKKAVKWAKEQGKAKYE